MPNNGTKGLKEEEQIKDEIIKSLKILRKTAHSRNANDLVKATKAIKFLKQHEEYLTPSQRSEYSDYATDIACPVAVRR